MAGFFGLFKSKTKYVDETESQTESQPQPKSEEKTEDFFLKPDDAKTLGDIDYMRKSMKIRRTFPKTRSNQSTEMVQEISSVDKKISSGGFGEITKPSAKSNREESLPSSQESSQRRSSDSSMDMFRNMARDLKKK